jgi:hypothetical protein
MKNPENSGLVLSVVPLDDSLDQIYEFYIKVEAEISKSLYSSTKFILHIGCPKSTLTFRNQKVYKTNFLQGLGSPP